MGILSEPRFTGYKDLQDEGNQGLLSGGHLNSEEIKLIFSNQCVKIFGTNYLYGRTKGHLEGKSFFGYQCHSSVQKNREDM